MSLRIQYILLCVLALVAAACKDSVGPGCGRCLPITAIAVDGQVQRLSGTLPPANVRLRFVIPGGSASRDTLTACVGTVIRDTILPLKNPGVFQARFTAGFPTFDACLDVRVAPSVAGAFPETAAGYPHLALRDTSMHDTLHIRILIP